MTSAPIMTSPRSVSQPIRTLVVDDSVVVRTVIERILNADPHYCVVNKSSSAEQALAFLADNKVDLVLLDIELPGQSGLAALPAIMEAGAGVKVAILSGKCEEGSAAAVEALALGASDILSKPGSGSFGEQFPQALVERLGRLFDDDVQQVRPIAPPPPPKNSMPKISAPPPPKPSQQTRKDFP